jgi:hypothetical protein
MGTAEVSLIILSAIGLDCTCNGLVEPTVSTAIALPRSAIQLLERKRCGLRCGARNYSSH